MWVDDRYAAVARKRPGDPDGSARAPCADDFSAASGWTFRRLVDVNTDGVTAFVEVDHDAVADLARVDSGTLGEIDVQTVGVWEVLDPCGLI